VQKRRRQHCRLQRHSYHLDGDDRSVAMMGCRSGISFNRRRSLAISNERRDSPIPQSGAALSLVYERVLGVQTGRYLAKCPIPDCHSQPVSIAEPESVQFSGERAYRRALRSCGRTVHSQVRDDRNRI
jgi:hypothetical protein